MYCMYKKLAIVLLIISVMVSGSVVSFAGESTVNSTESSISNTSQSDESIVTPLSNKHKIVSVYQSTDGDTKYNSDKTRKCVWQEKHYKVYQENIGTGVRQFLYSEYRWTWKGYKKVNGSWTYVKTKSGVTRNHTNASNIYSFLTSF